MSSVEEQKELKAGHPPAVKAGGMRVARPGRTASGSEDKQPIDQEEQLEYADSPVKDKTTVVVSGAVAKGDMDFPPEAVKQYHEKPAPAKVNRAPNPQQRHNIQQPR